jgi:hypothetical protein
MRLIPDKERRGHTGTAHQCRCGGGTAASLRARALRAVRQFARLEVDSDKMALSRPAHADAIPLKGHKASREAAR